MMNDVQLVAFILVLTRVSAFIAFFPLFAKRQLPSMVKVGMAGGLTFFWYGMVETKLQQSGGFVLDLNVVSSLLLLGKEVTIGLVLSIALGLFFLPAKIARKIHRLYCREFSKPWEFCCFLGLTCTTF